MPRDVDDRKKRRALRKLRKAADLAEQGLGPPLSDWEQTFLEELEERIETYGSAFADPTKGDLSEPLSALQQKKLKEIDKKARGKGKPLKSTKGMGQGKGAETGRAKGKLGSKAARSKITRKSQEGRAIPRQPVPDLRGVAPASALGKTSKPRLVRSNDSVNDPSQSDAVEDRTEREGAEPPPKRSDDGRRPALRIIDGGKSD